MKHWFLYLVVAVAGAAVLALEILGTRILGPFYGVSLYLWSALITTTLAALSVGYLVGGYVADRGATLGKLASILAVAGIWVFLTPWIKHPFLTLAEPLGLRLAVLTASVVLFFVPLALLGMISPLAIKLNTSTLDEVGRSAGKLYAISTLASVGAALLTGFVLIPSIGVNRLTFAIGGVLLLTAIATVSGFRRTRIGAGAALVVVCSFLVVSWGMIGERPDPDRGLLAIEQSPYGELRVIDNDNGRHLLIDGGIHTLSDTSTWESYLHYAAVMDLPKNFFDKPGRALLIGLGGGSLVKQYSRDGWSVEAVEIDPDVIQLAREYFGLQPSEGTVIEMDGRQYLASTKSMYDVILLDVYGSSSIPFHLVTKEAFGLVAERLNRNGIVAVNVEAIGWTDPIVATIAVTLKQQFQNVLALPMEEPPNKFGNMVLLASNRPLDPLRVPEGNVTLEPDWRYGPEYQKVHAWDNRFVPNITNATVLTDDLNPIDLRSEVIKLAARRGLHRYFGTDGESW